MRVIPPLKTLIVLSTFAMVTACMAPGMYGPDGVTVITVQWDPAPLDRDYRVHYDQMVVRHHDEDDHPQHDESSEQRHNRHRDEDKNLEKRYKKGKKEHRDKLPDSDR